MAESATPELKTDEQRKAAALAAQNAALKAALRREQQRRAEEEEAAAMEPSPARKIANTAKATGDAAKKTGQSVLKTADRMWHFFDGTIRGALDGCAKFGRIGLWLGVAAGVASMLIPGGLLIAGFEFAGLALPFYGALAGAVAGSGLGLVQGALTGGAERVALETRREKYASELSERRSARTTAPARRINRIYDRQRDHNDRINYDKFDQYNDRISQQNQGSWVERVEASRDNSDLGR